MQKIPMPRSHETHTLLSLFCVSVPIVWVSGLQGMTGVLPCEVTREHGVTLILWFKDNATKPMYRYTFTFQRS